MNNHETEKAVLDPSSPIQREIDPDALKKRVKESGQANADDVSDRFEELRTLNRLAKKYMWDTAAHRIMQTHGLQFGPNRFYSQIPSIQDIETSFEYDGVFDEKGPFWNDRIYNVSLVSEFIDMTMEFADEFDPPQDGNMGSPKSFFWNNPAFSGADAMAYYCNIRQFKPDHIVEIGSGYSSLVAMEALRKNGSGSLTCIEPFPMKWLDDNRKEGGPLEGMNLIRTPIQKMDPSKINALLNDGDILFIDSTHTVKAGSDCLWIYLKILPELTADLFIHVHDIPLPFPRNKNRAINEHIHWTEAYLLQAYLLENARTEVYFGSCLASRLLKEKLDRYMGDKSKKYGESFWFRQTGLTPGG